MNGSAHALFCVNFHRESALKRGQNLNLSTHSRIALHYCEGHGKFYVPLINVVAVSPPVFLISRACHQAPKSALTINLLLSYYGPSFRRSLIVHPSLLVFFQYSTFIFTFRLLLCLLLSLPREVSRMRFQVLGCALALGKFCTLRVQLRS